METDWTIREKICESALAKTIPIIMGFIQTTHLESLEYIGISSGKWTANIGYQRKQIHLGSFNDFEDAVIARQEAEKKYFKEYRRIS